LFFSSTVAAQDSNYASLDNVAYGMLGPWYNPATSGQGFDVEFYSETNGRSDAVIFWYTFDPTGTHKVWFAASGPIVKNSAHTQIFEASEYQPFNQPPAAGSENKSIGTMDFELVDCSHAHISWRFDHTLANGLGATNDGETDLRRVTPVISVLGQDLCSTPLTSFASSDADSATIDQLEAEISSLQADVNSAYSEGYSSGYSDGYNDGYSDGYNQGYSDGSQQSCADSGVTGSSAQEPEARIKAAMTSKSAGNAETRQSGSIPISMRIEKIKQQLESMRTNLQRVQN